MSTKLGTLTLDLVTKIGNFVGPIKDGEKQVKVSFENMRKHVNTYGTAVAAIGASAVTALAGMAVQTANQAAELERFAFRANTTTQEFQKMAVGAQAYGIEQEKLSDMMKDFNEKLGELTTIGAGGGVDFFEQIAVKTEGSSAAAKKLILDMQKLSGPEALQMYVDKLEEAGVTQQQMSFYLESMASDMTDLIPLLVNGGEGMQLYGDLAERAGIIMSDKTMESAKLLKDQVYMLDLQLQGAKNQLMTAVIPAFVDITDAFFDGGESGLAFESVAEGIANTLKVLASIAIGAATAFNLVGKSIGALAAVGANISSEVDWYEMNPVGLAKAALAAREKNAAVFSVFKEDLESTMAAADKRQSAVWGGEASGSAEKLRAFREQQEKVKSSTNGVTAGLDELVKKQDKAAGATAKSSKAASEFNQVLQEQQRIIRDYSTGDRQGEIDLEKEIQRLRKNNMAEYIPLAEARYQQEKKLNDMRNAFELVEHRLTQNQKLAYSHNIKEQEIKADAKLTKEQQQAKLQSLREQYELELRKTRWHALEIQQVMQEAIQGLSYGADDIFAKATMSAGEYARWSAENDRSNAKSGLKNQRVGVEQDIMASDLYSTDDDRYEALLEAHREYRDGMAAIDVQYAEQIKELDAQRYDDTVGMYGALLSQASSVWGDMTQIVKDSAGEQSGEYKAMFLAQQMFAIGSALLSTHLASAQVLADPTALTMAQKATYSSMILGMGYANVGLIAAQTISGMAHDGIDSIPSEGTWLLDKGERVVDSRTNSDLKSYLSGQKQQSPVINIHNAPPGTTATQNSDGSIDIDLVERQLANRLSNANSVISKSLKQNTTASRRR